MAIWRQNKQNKQNKQNDQHKQHDQNHPAKTPFLPNRPKATAGRIAENNGGPMA